ncbi:hypothetical protein WJX84_012252 [Apatococcus fuscideae]|uniref:Amidase domain-containing protein n=1 Tax=Apatococcus fuscideae TaxID=2026836 RepID=A0AAW1TGJ4_9CHLO
MEGDDLAVQSLISSYRAGTRTPLSTAEAVAKQTAGFDSTFLQLEPATELQTRCREIESAQAEGAGALHGVPFAVKDNIDVAGRPTTAACPAFQYTPEAHAPCVQALLDQGAVFIGKTNMDQFAAGLVGTRSPYGTPPNAFDDRFVPGGSSSGSAAAVAAGLVSFALGTDTAGSGRVPAGLNGCVGIKPTLGTITTTGVVPAAASFDCVTVFARSVPDAALAVKIMQGAGSLSDPRWRRPPPDLPSIPQPHFRFGVPSAEFLDFSGPRGSLAEAEYAKAMQHAVDRLTRLGGQQVPVDFGPFLKVASLLYESGLIAERYHGILDFLTAGKGAASTPEAVAQDDRLERVTAAILANGAKCSGADVYEGLTQLHNLKAVTRLELDKVDILMVPTVLHHYTVAEIEQEEKGPAEVAWTQNAKQGRFTNFVNLLDMCGVSLPSSLVTLPPLSQLDKPEAGASAESLHLPFGVTLLAPAWHDEALWKVAELYHKSTGLGCGPNGHGVTPVHARLPSAAPA